MAGSPHYNELLRILNEGGVEYLIVGGYRAAVHEGSRHLGEQFAAELPPSL